MILEWDQNKNQLNEGKKVYIDLRHLSREHIETKLPSLYKSAYAQAGVNHILKLQETTVKKAVNQ